MCKNLLSVKRKKFTHVYRNSFSHIKENNFKPARTTRDRNLSESYLDVSNWMLHLEGRMKEGVTPAEKHHTHW